jgi:MYXO-CTERM domain-containing protein
MIASSLQNISAPRHGSSLRTGMTSSISVASAAVALVLVSNTFADITQPWRRTTTTLTGTSGTFSNARYGYANDLTVQASVRGEVQTDEFGYRSNFQNVSALVTTGDATLNFGAAALDPVDSMYKSPYTLTFGGSNLTSTWRVAYEGGVVAGATPGGESFISQTQVMRNGQLHWALVFDGGGSGGVSEGGTFTSTVVMAGQWSRAGTGAGSVEFSYNSAYYTIASNFLYDGANTTFAVTTNAYVTTADGEGNNPTIQMTLIGEVVPSPGAVALLGLAGVVGARRRRG